VNQLQQQCCIYAAQHKNYAVSLLFVLRRAIGARLPAIRAALPNLQAFAQIASK
jgi:hypothetical protein